MKKIALVSVIVIVIDVISKVLVQSFLTYNSRVTIIANFFYLNYVKNTGAAFSILEGSTYILTIIGVIVILYLIYYIKKNKITNKFDIIGFGLLIGGAISNIIDRIAYGYVIDFLDFNIFNYNFPIFNIADVCIVLGILILIINTLRRR